MSRDDDARSSGKTNEVSKTPADDYPAHVNADLHAVLKSYSRCTCLTGLGHSREGHHARLKLCDNVVKDDGHVAFDMLSSSLPTAWDHWQDLQIRVSIRKKASKAVKLS
ncbi:uncharacterized protein ColSpa_11260 [Colletotrichum spaethianum]|uniref:Uncharacterized protein n=1 Tax=Colletotrichum spaethianum TaxID=700344 RepID=A0AA37PF57_9PEZI|nr:uncharacterized protein ColSpa_11260 [Colletotrichum spaethianum]GKT51079.1 hypothetical protein ColSpa_11260 [Colletotrichum spaethianum]